MATMASRTQPAWGAEVTWERRCTVPMVPRPDEERPDGEPDGEELPGDEPEVEYVVVWDCFVVASRRGSEPIRFRVNRRRGRPVSVTDPRLRVTGIAGTTGIWGTLPPARAERPRPLTLIEFRRELARLVGAERSEQIFGMIGA